MGSYKLGKKKQNNKTSQIWPLQTHNSKLIALCSMSAPASKAGQATGSPCPWAASHTLDLLQPSTGTVQAQLHLPGFAPSRMFGWWMYTPCSTTCLSPWPVWMWTQKGVGETTDYSNNPDGDQVGKKEEHSRKHHIPSKRKRIKKMRKSWLTGLKYLVCETKNH